MFMSLESRYIHEWLPNVKHEEVNLIIHTINRTMENKRLIKIFRMDLPGAGSEKSRNIDHAILTALFNNHRKPDPDEWLKMAMSWDRADIDMDIKYKISLIDQNFVKIKNLLL